MMTSIDRVRLTAAVCLLLVGARAAGAAEDVSRWDGDARGARLIAGAQATGGGPRWCAPASRSG